MNAKVFFDTNIFVYNLDATDPLKQTAATAIIREAIDAKDGAISSQVVNEFFNAVLRKAAGPLSFEEIDLHLASVFEQMHFVSLQLRTHREALAVHQRYQLHIYDALIVAAALAAGCTTLYSEDMQHGQQFGPLTVRNPFV